MSHIDSSSQAVLKHDALVIGPGFGGMYALHVLREAASKVCTYREATAAGARDTGIDIRWAGRIPRRPLLSIYVFRRTRARVRLAGAIPPISQRYSNTLISSPTDSICATISVLAREFPAPHTIRVRSAGTSKPRRAKRCAHSFSYARQARCPLRTLPRFPALQVLLASVGTPDAG